MRDAISFARGGDQSNHHWLYFYLPAEDTENKIHHKKGADDDHRDEVDPLPGITHGVLDLV